MDWEFAILDFIAEHMHTRAFDQMLAFITHLGDAGAVWIVLSVVLLLIPRYRKIGTASALALLMMLLIGNLGLKPLIERMRPFQVREGISLLIGEPHGYSFPSGHTLTAFAAATAIYIGNRKLGIPALILAGVIAFSRMYFYVHFPTDILGGMVLGIVCAVLSWKILEKVYRKKEEK